MITFEVCLKLLIKGLISLIKVFIFSLDIFLALLGLLLAVPHL